METLNWYVSTQIIQNLVMGMCWTVSCVHTMSSSALWLRLLPVVSPLSTLKLLILFVNGFPLIQGKCKPSVTVLTWQCVMLKFTPYSTQRVSFQPTIQPTAPTDTFAPWQRPCDGQRNCDAITDRPLLCLMAVSYEQPAKLLRTTLVAPSLKVS